MDLCIEVGLQNQYGKLVVKRELTAWWLELNCFVTGSSRKKVSFDTCVDLLTGVLYDEVVMDKIVAQIKRENPRLENIRLSGCGMKMFADVFDIDLGDYKKLVIGVGESHLELILDTFKVITLTTPPLLYVWEAH